MRGPEQFKRQAKQLFRMCLVNGSLDSGRTRQLVRRVIEAKHRGYLTVLSHFERLARLDYMKHTAAIESAIPLSADARASVQAHLEELYGAGLNTLFRQEPALIGGMRVTVGSDIYDSSVRFKLAALEKSF